MAWTTPKTWAVGEPMTAADLNTYMRDNMLALKSPPTALVKLDEPNDYTTTSTTFVAVDISRLSLSVVSTGGDVMISFSGNIYNASYPTYLDVEFDGVALGGDDGLARAPVGHSFAGFSILKTGVSAGSHTIRLFWKAGNSGAASTLAAGTTTLSGFNTHAYFWAREI